MSITGQQFSDIIKYPFQDKEWFSKLCLQGAVIMALSFVFVGIPFSIGFTIRCLQKGMAGDDTLPGWDEWGAYWRLGWKAIAVNLIYALPLIVVWSLVLPIIIITAIFGEANSDITPILGGLTVIVIILAYGVTMIYSLLMMCVQPVLHTAVAADKTIRECVQWHTIWGYIKANVLNIVVGIAIVYLAGMIASLGMFIFFFGFFLTIGYSMAVTGYTYGIIYRHSTVKF